MTPLLLFVFFTVCLLGSYLYERYHRRRTTETLKTSPAPLLFQDYRLPEGIFFHPGHTWALVQPDGRIRVGIDDFLRRMAGQACEVELPEVGSAIERDESLFTLPLDGMELHVRPPLSGTILARCIGSTLEELERDWLILMQPDHLAHDLPALNLAHKARTWLEEEIDRFKEFLVVQAQRPALAGATLPDGGEPVVGVLTLLDDKGLRVFERQFLQPTDPSTEH